MVEAKKPGDQSNDEKCDGVVQHDVSPKAVVKYFVRESVQKTVNLKS